MKKIFFIWYLCLFIGCKKDGGKGCWMPFSPSGSDASNAPVCDATKTEVENRFPGTWVYKYPETKYCWRADKPGDPQFPKYLYGIPESVKGNMESMWHYTLSKIDCGSFCLITWNEKHKSKLTGFYGPTLGMQETFVNADTCSKLFVGRVILYRETTDSLITREVSNKKP